MHRFTKTSAIALAAAALLPTTAAAQTSDPWQFDAAIYLYLPSVGQKTQFGQSGSGSEVSFNPNNILDSLNAAFMGSFQARRGVWGVYTDFVYVDFSNSRSGSLRRSTFPVSVKGSCGIIKNFAGINSNGNRSRR